MKNVLIILSQGEYSSLNAIESVQAAMVFASFDLKISVLFKAAGLSLLYPAHQTTLKIDEFLKPIRNMIESFEFDDIEQFFILKKDENSVLLQNCLYPIIAIDFNAAFIRQFDHVISW